MRIRAYSVFEGVIYHSHALDLDNPCRPTLEVEAVVREGDVDAGPLLLPVAEYLVMVGEPHGSRCLRELRRRGRVVDFMGVPHLSFPFWTPVDLEHR
ncbi:MAG TPA: hypothetical protein VK866_02760 [Acidimicrobiales bacterium]|nr:hypothetical protein [Acidimicrobiales bacterium]